MSSEVSSADSLAKSWLEARRKIKTRALGGRQGRTKMDKTKGKPLPLPQSGRIALQNFSCEFEQPKCVWKTFGQKPRRQGQWGAGKRGKSHHKASMTDTRQHTPLHSLTAYSGLSFRWSSFVVEFLLERWHTIVFNLILLRKLSGNPVSIICLMSSCCAELCVGPDDGKLQGQRRKLVLGSGHNTNSYSHGSRYRFWIFKSSLKTEFKIVALASTLGGVIAQLPPLIPKVCSYNP